MDTLYTFWDNITHYKTESVHFLALMNSAPKYIYIMYNIVEYEYRKQENTCVYLYIYMCFGELASASKEYL